MYGMMSLKEEILDPERVNQIKGISIEQVADLEDEPGVDMEVFNSIMRDELMTVTKEMLNTCRQCEISKRCCKTECKVFERGVKFREVMGSDFNICYNCPEKDSNCLGYEYAHEMQFDEEYKMKNVRFTPRELEKNSIINQEEKEVLENEGYSEIDHYEFDKIDEEGLLSDTTMQDISKYAFKKGSIQGVNVNKLRNMVSDTNVSVKTASVEDVEEVEVVKTRSGNYMGVIRRESDEDVKFYVKDSYVSMQEKDVSLLSKIRDKIAYLIGNDDYQLPDKLYAFK